MSSVAALAAHLRSLTEEQLAELVATRRDATIEPVPQTVDQLAERLLHSTSMAVASVPLNSPQLEVLEAAAALGDGCSTKRLAELFGVPEDDLDLAEALRHLVALALVWPRAGGFAAGHLSAMLPHPLDLGAGAAELLGAQSWNNLRKMAGLYGISAVGRVKDELVLELAGWLAEPENVRRLVAEAPPGVHRQLNELAWQSEPVFGSPGMVLPWDVERGLLARSMWNYAVMPREVALALRDGFRAPFSPRPPELTLTPVDSGLVEREAAAAATETLAAITAVVEVVSAGTFPLLKTGGLGVRELRRIVKSAGQDEDRTRLTVELLTAGGFIDVSQDDLTPSTVYDEFAEYEPADQLLEVIGDWLTMPASPLAPAGPGARVLCWNEEEELILTGLRALALRTLLDVVPAGQSVEPGALAARLHWVSPIMTDRGGDDLERYVMGIWREAHRLGLLAHGAVTSLARSLLDSGPDDAREHAAAMLPRFQDSVVLQNDLTAVVTGTPSAGLLALLDGAATPESRSGAWTWRFSPGSVRAALDAGSSPEGLIARITAAAEGGRVPQTLTCLIEDVARRHGQVQVRAAGCCLCSDDETLLTEIANTRSLRALGLVRLAPTVLVSAKPQAETLVALREAGYAPAGIRTDGSPAIEIPKRRRAVPEPLSDLEEAFPMPAPGDPVTMAQNLRRE